MEEIPFFATLPQVLKGKNDAQIPLTQVKDDYQFIGLYFSAHWCGPCRAFTPQLAEFYKRINSEYKQVEIIFVSLDQSEEQFNSYYASMPWIAVPFDSDTREMLGDIYGVQGIPTLIIFDNNGKLIDNNARSTLNFKKDDAITEWQSRV
jgi:nucleoredoxin